MYILVSTLPSIVRTTRIADKHFKSEKDDSSELHPHKKNIARPKVSTQMQTEMRMNLGYGVSDERITLLFTVRQSHLV